MLELLHPELDARRLRVVATERCDGDVHPQRVDRPTLEARQGAVSGRRWVMVDQVHGTDVHTVRAHDTDGPPTAAVADVLVVDATVPPVAVWAADCAPVLLVGRDGRLVLFHAGWRGLADGVIDVAVAALDEPVAVAALGPCIHPCCYEFGVDDLDAVATGVGTGRAELAGTTSTGRPALDVPAAVGAGLAGHGIELDLCGPCTGCDDRWFSHRVRGDVGRHAMVVWST